MATWGEDNNNPGCILGKSYRTLEDGYVALNKLLIRGYNNRTALSIFNKYAPSYHGNNNPQLYADLVIKRLRSRGVRDRNGELVNASTRFDFTDPVIRGEFTMAISRVENRNKVLGGEQFALACANAFQQKYYGNASPELPLTAVQSASSNPSIEESRLVPRVNHRRQRKATASSNPQTHQIHQAEMERSIQQQNQPALMISNEVDTTKLSERPSWWRLNMPSWLGGMTDAEKEEWRIKESIEKATLAIEKTISKTDLTQEEQKAFSQLFQQKLGLNARLGMHGSHVVVSHQELKQIGLSKQDIEQLTLAVQQHGRDMA